MSAQPERGGVHFGTTPGRWVLFVTVLGSALGFLDATVVNVALPANGRELDAEVAGLQWVLNGYLLALAALICSGARSAIATDGGASSSSASLVHRRFGLLRVRTATPSRPPARA